MEDILELLATGMASGPAALVIRHAERPPILVNDGYRMTGLTDRGMDDALGLGMAISGYSTAFRFHHSPVKRCLQTAEMMHIGVVKSGKRSEFCGPRETLGVSYMLADMDSGFSVSDSHGNGFIRAWFDGHLEPDIYMPMKESLDQHMGYIRSTVKDSPGLDVHVTHDWNINVLREGIFGIRHEDAGWPGFLSGLLFTRGPGGLVAHVRNGGRVLTASIPL